MKQPALLKVQSAIQGCPNIETLEHRQLHGPGVWQFVMAAVQQSVCHQITLPYRPNTSINKTIDQSTIDKTNQ